MKLKKVSDFLEHVLMEELAATEHERWSHWQKYMHSLCTGNADGSLIIPADKVEHWEKLIATPYAELSEHSKQSDRDQVMKYVECIRESGKDYAVIIC